MNVGNGTRNWNELNLFNICVFVQTPQTVTRGFWAKNVTLKASMPTLRQPFIHCNNPAFELQFTGVQLKTLQLENAKRFATQLLSPRALLERDAKG